MNKYEVLGIVGEGTVGKRHAIELVLCFPHLYLMLGPVGGHRRLWCCFEV